MYYKVIFNNRVIDVLDRLVYLKYQPRNNIMVLCDEFEAQAILSSDQRKRWHIEGLYDIPVDGYDTVVLEEIDKYEYESLKMLNLKSAEEIIDNFVMGLIEEGVL